MTSAEATLDIKAKALLADLQQLQSTPPTTDSLPAWFKKLDSVKKAMQTLWLERLVALYRDTSDQQGKALHQRFTEFWLPQLEAFDKPLAELALNAGIARVQPTVAERLLEEIKEEASEEILALIAQERQLSTGYSTITAPLTIEHHGESMSLEAADGLLNASTDRAEREEIWRKVTAAKRTVSEQLDALFLQLIETRQQIAQAKGAVNHVEYQWRFSQRLVSPEQALKFLDDLSTPLSELTALAHTIRSKSLGVPRLKPWDTDVRLVEPTTLHLNVGDYADTAEQVLTRLDSQFAEVLRVIRQDGVLDLPPRPGKRPGNFAAHYFALGRSDIVCNVTGGVEDFRALLHELGHAIHHHAISADPKHTFWDFLDFIEVEEYFAFVFTYLGTLELLNSVQFTPAERSWYLRSMAERILKRFQDVDERLRFELWVYARPGVGIAEMDAYYLSIVKSIGVDWSDQQNMLQKHWQKNHTFSRSFYNLDYAIAMLAALLTVHAYQQAPTQTLKGIQAALPMGATKGVKTIFSQLGIEFPLSSVQISEALGVLKSWLKEEI